MRPDASRFHSYADIFKVHVIASDNDYLSHYEVIASVHNGSLSNLYYLCDQEYLGQRL